MSYGPCPYSIVFFAVCGAVLAQRGGTLGTCWRELTYWRQHYNGWACRLVRQADQAVIHEERRSPA